MAAPFRSDVDSAETNEKQKWCQTKNLLKAQGICNIHLVNKNKHVGKPHG